MCHHRSVGKWRKWWAAWSLTVLSTFLTAEIIGLVTVGPEATLSYDIQCRAGTDEPCPHTALGRLVIVAFFAWATAHLGWGRFGAGWLFNFCRRFRRPTSGGSACPQ